LNCLGSRDIIPKVIGNVAQHRWTLAFRDQALEQAYRRDLALRTRTQVTVILALELLFWIGAAPLDSVIAGPVNGPGLTAMRLGLGVPPLFLALLLHARLPREAFLRWGTLAVLLGTQSLTLTVVLFVALSPVVAALPMAHVTQTWILGAFVYALLYGLPVARAVPVMMLSTAALFCVSAWRQAPFVPSDAFSTIASVQIALFGAYLLERARREAFAANLRARRLLDNVLPPTIADRLERGEHRIADQSDAATVLFADLVGFTVLAGRMSPTMLVETLDGLFTQFDDLAARHGLEKIKTIGDAYMVVGGVPASRPDHAAAVARLALDMRDLVASRSDLQIRIGIHSGPVVAGVIGSRKFLFDLWGDTVNLASRMESHGIPGAIQVTAATAALLEPAFICEPRGAIPIKGKPDQLTFLLVAARSESLVN
jgi:class 3 adenylate cyclase